MKMHVNSLLLALLTACVNGRRGGNRNRQGEVCSSQGIKYADKCAFVQATCKPNDRSFDDVTMKKRCYGPSVQRKKMSVCVFTEDGTSVETKQLCELLKAKCEKKSPPVKFHNGICQECTKQNLCPWEESKRRKGFRRNGPEFRFCASDGSKYKSLCDFHIAKCVAYKTDKTVLKVKMCNKKKGSKKASEVCATDGVKYTDKCSFLKATCKPNDRSYDHIMLARCGSVRVDRKKKPNICVLSQDEKSVETRQHCEFHKAKCENRIAPKRFYSGDCGVCTKENVCPYERRRKGGPRQRRKRSKNRICTLDGSSYANICEFHIAKCKMYQKDKTVLKTKKCSFGKKNQKKKKGGRKGGQRRKQTGVCSTDGVKYTDTCSFLKATCKPNDRSYDYIMLARCGSVRVDRKKKPNICVLSQDEKSVETRQHCEFHKAKCENRIAPKRFYSGDCGVCTKENVCPFERRRKAEGSKRKRNVRPMNRKNFRVCADDGSAYESLCDFHVAKCKKFKEDKVILKLVQMGRRRGRFSCQEEVNRKKLNSDRRGGSRSDNEENI